MSNNCQTIQYILHSYKNYHLNVVEGFVCLTKTSFVDETESEDLGEAPPIFLAEVTEVVKKHSTSRVADQSGGSQFQKWGLEGMLQLPQKEQCQYHSGCGTMNQWTSSLSSQECWGGHGSLTVQSTCVLWTQRRPMTVSPKGPCGGKERAWGTRDTQLSH